MRKPRKKKEFIKQTLLIIPSFVMGGIVMLLLVKYTPFVQNYIVTKNETMIYEKNSLAPAVEKIYDAVTVVQSYNNDVVAETGTGFIYKVDSKYGYVLTNEHVLENANEIKVILTNEDEKEAEVLGKDEYLDIAVLRIDKKNITLVANIGSSEKANLGDTVFTVGTPLGYDYRGSITAGVISGKDRKVPINTSTNKEDDWIMRVLQIDASINPGNSGGPLLNAKGEVIGVCTLKLTDSDVEGMGFAIPIEYAMNHIDSLEKGKKIKWPVLGINMVNITDSSALVKNEIKIPTNINEGVAVTDIKEKSSASSKLEKGDIITHINNNKVKDIAHLRYELYQYSSGDTITITLLRKEKEKKIKVSLME